MCDHPPNRLNKTETEVLQQRDQSFFKSVKRFFQRKDTTIEAKKRLKDVVEKDRDLSRR